MTLYKYTQVTNTGEKGGWMKKRRKKTKNVDFFGAEVMN